MGTYVTPTNRETTGGVDSNNNGVSVHIPEDPLINDDVRYIFDIVFFASFCCAIGCLGSIANVINIVIFIKQGFNDSVNISLLGLALSDLGSLITLLWMAISLNPLFRYSNIPFESNDVEYLTAGWPHVCCGRITSWITAFITFERCICIALPMKVKSIITAKRTFITIVAIFLIMIASVAPVFYAVRIGPKFYAGRNKTLYGLVYADYGPFIENISFSISVFAQISSFVIVIVCTVILVHNLILKSKWRSEKANVSASGSKDAMATRDKKVVKMVTFISCIFLVCFLPTAVNLILMLSFSPDYSAVGKYHNTFKVVWSVLNMLEGTNSSVNIIVYYHMSTKYKTAFLNMFCSNNDSGDKSK